MGTSVNNQMPSTDGSPHSDLQRSDLLPSDLRPVRRRRGYTPAIRSLEPRFVLNATAELNALGQLAIIGDAAADTIRLETLSSGDVLVRDGTNAVIPIANHPGVATSPLNLSAVTAGEIIVDLGAGNDLLDLQIPTGIDITVVDSSGDDSVNLEFASTGATPGNNLIDVSADTITLDPPDTAIGFTNNDVQLTGNVIAGVTGTNSQITIGGGDWTIVGTLTLDGSVTFFSSGGAIDLSGATLTASAPSVDVDFALNGPAANLTIGGVDGSGGQLIENILISGASSLTTTDTIEISGQFSAPAVTGPIQIDSPITASVIGIDSQSTVTVDGDVTTTDGALVISADQSIRLTGNVSTVAAGSLGSVLLSGTTLQLVDNQLVTSGGDIDVSAETQIVGNVLIDSGNASSAVNAGDIDFFGAVTSDDAIDDRLTILAQGVSAGSGSGTVSVQGPIGGFVGGLDLNELVINAQQIEVASIGVTNGNVSLVAPDIRPTGLVWRTTGSGDILADGVVKLPSSDLQINSAGSVRFTDDLVGQTATSDLDITAADEVRFDATVSGFGGLTVNTLGQVRFADDVSLQGNLDLSGDLGIEIAAASFNTAGNIVLQDDVLFQANSQVDASQIQFEGVVQVDASTSATINAPIVNPVAATSLTKAGTGTLVLAGANTFSVPTQIDAGTLTVESLIPSGAGLVTVANGARLQGDGQVLADVLVQNGGILAPGILPTLTQTGNQEATIVAESVTLSPGSIFEFDISGINAGFDLDQLVIDAGNSVDDSVTIDGAILDLQVNGSQPPSTEFVLINNDGVDPISGRFVFNQDVNGNSLATPRVLNEGDEVLTSLGPGGPSALITYFGGDGNDVTIVTAGSVNTPSAGVTLITRLGVNLEVRTGANLAAAQGAAPTVRTISGLNNNDLTIVGNAGADTVFVDLDGFVDPTGATVNFSGNIQIDANEGTGENDRLILFDSDPTTNDVPESLAYQFAANESGSITVETVGTAPNFTIGFDGVESIEQDVSTPDLSLRFTDASELIQLSQDPADASRTLVSQSISGVSQTSLSFLNPTDTLSINTQDGDDQIELNDLGTSNVLGTSAGGLQAQVTIDGETGTDSIVVNSALSLGSGPVTGDFNASAENISINANIDTTGGDVNGNVILNGGASVVVDSVVNVDNGFIVINAGGGTIDAGNGQLISNFAGDAIRLNNATNVVLGDIVTPGTLQIGQSQNVTGAVFQAVGTVIEADRFTASTSGTIDLSNLDNRIGILDNVLSGGDITVVDSDLDLNVTAVNSSGNNVAISASGSLLLDNDAITAVGAVVDLAAAVGIEDIDPDENVVNVSAAVISLTGGSLGIGQNSSEIDLFASQAINATTELFNGDISLASRGNAFPVGLIDAGSGDVDLEADSIDDATVDSTADLIANRVQLTATTGIGVNERLELLSVSEVDATTNSGGIDLDLSATDASIAQVITGSGDIRVSQTGGQTLDIERIENADGSVEITNTDGNIIIAGDGVDPVAIAVGGAGSIELNAVGNSSNLVVASAIESNSGSIDLLAGSNVIFNADGDVSSTAGTIVVRGDQAENGNGATVGLSDGAVIDAGVGAIDIQTDGTITLGSVVTTNSTSDAVLIVSRSDSINDSGDQDIDIVANFGTVTLQAQTGIGDADSIESEIAIVNADADVSGAIRLTETDEITLASLVTDDGQIEIVANGTITATYVQSTNINALDDANASADADSRDILLTATGEFSDILVDRVVAGSSADVFLVADDDVLETDALDDRLVESDDLFVFAGNATADQIDAVSLSTAINDLEITVGGTAQGDVEIREFDSLNLAASDRQDDLERIETANGEIRVFAQDSIVIADPDIANETITLTVDPELVAGGDNGRVQLRAANVIQLGDAVQLQASQSTIDAVIIESDVIELGEMIEINTGQGVGVARIFSPRPDINLVDTAFFESTSVSVNILEQAAINDAEGQLTLDIGNEGERGLTINIDWGAATDRFQQIDNLSGDAPPLTISHVYSEADILNSQLNGRESATDPLNVKFSVRHHESILVLGSTVTQNDSDVEQVDGLLVSSTDNPLTAEGEQVPILENGAAGFIIPSLSIPVAFFPVRDVIPELDEPEQFTRSEQTVALSGSTFETAETSTSTSVSREEFFQIRVLSPDPDGEDLAPPERLPDDILDGDKLRALFSNLPDGRYEIEYVLGDGNERSILQVDLRDGKPIIPSEELDEGPLRLREINSENDGTNGDDVQQDQNQDEVRSVESIKHILHRGLIQVESEHINGAEAKDESADKSKEGANASVAISAISAVTVSRRGKLGRFSAVSRFLSRSNRERTA